MGCCSGVQRNMHSNEDIFIIPYNDKQSKLDNIKDNSEDYNNFHKTKKELIRQEELMIEIKNQNLPKNDKNEINKDKDITPKTEFESGEKKLKSKKKFIKKGSKRVQQAALELKLLSLKELDNNKKYFNQN